MKKQLLIGCGHSREKRMYLDDNKEWDEVITLDKNEDCKPNILHDLESVPLPVEENTFDEIHAYGVLEHLSDQGDHVSFLKQFEDYHRILKPNGLLFAIVPNCNHAQQWGDPSHRRVINLITLAFLSQDSYKQCGTTMMTDFRSIYKGDFVLTWQQETPELLYFVLKAIKDVSGWIS